MIVNLDDISAAQAQKYLNSAIAPRPIAFVSTIDKEGKVNLSPFSYFNLFSVNPPILIFSPSRRVRDNTTKHTLQNIEEVPEAAVNIVTYDMVQQVSLSSCEYPKEVNEFAKAGFTQQNAIYIKPPLVLESPISLECKVLEIKQLGQLAGAGNLVICQVICMHINEAVLKEGSLDIDGTKIEQVARLGDNWYCKADNRSMFTVTKPNTKLGIGWDGLPQPLLQSKVLTGNHLAQLANVEAVPVMDTSFTNMAATFILRQYKNNFSKRNYFLHKLAAELLTNNKVDDAWQVLLRCTDFEGEELEPRFALREKIQSII